MSNEAKDNYTRIRVREESRPLWDAIASAKGWTFSEAAHRIAQHFCQIEGIPVDPHRHDGPRRRRRIKSAA
jgi:hypothetical protein